VSRSFTFDDVLTLGNSVLNGDLITEESTCTCIPFFFIYLFPVRYLQANSTTLIDEVVKPLNEAEIPFSSIHGVTLAVCVGSPFYIPPIEP
jgi:hypothetical protein